MTSRKRNFMIIVLTLALVATGLSASYAWLVSHGNSQDVVGYMGTVAVGISSGNYGTNGTNGTAVDDEGKLAFKITNGSNIDTYMRLGWTPIYRNAAGEDLTKDTSGITIAVNLANDAPDELIMASSAINSLNDYQKKTIPLLYYNEKDEKNCYLPVPAGTPITGTINVTDGIDMDAIDRGETLHIILVPEAIQATKAAVTAASAYGWDEDLVDKQACTIVGGGE